MNGVAEIVGGVEDHVHLLASLRPVHCLADVMRDLKKDSTNWVKENLDRTFAWQEGYAAFSVSASNLAAVVKYIQDQESHHRKISFEDEYLALLKKHGVEFDPKYVFG